jgi:hypothetical protein
MTKVKNQLSKTLSIVSLLVSTYLTVILIRDIGFVYDNAMSWSEGDTFVAVCTSIFVGSSLLSSLLITFLIYRGVYTYWLIIPLLHIAFVSVSLPVYLLVLVVLIWNASQYSVFNNKKNSS